jgi:hypothetical protein
LERPKIAPQDTEILTLSRPLTLDLVTESLFLVGRWTKLESKVDGGKKGIFDYCIHLIQRCLNEGRTDLIEKAARVLQGDKKLIAQMMLKYTANRCEDHLEWRGQEDIIFPSKSAVLEVFERWFPDLKDEIPTSKTQRAVWWQEAGLDHLPQDRHALNTDSVKLWHKLLEKSKRPKIPPPWALAGLSGEDWV